MGIDIGKNSFHVVGLDQRGAIVVRQRWTRSQIRARLANIAPCLIGMEACVGAHHLSRKLHSLGHDARLMPAEYVHPYRKGQKNDFRDAEAIADGPYIGSEMAQREAVARIEANLPMDGQECAKSGPSLVPPPQRPLRSSTHRPYWLDCATAIRSI
jgi:hypothetical protein